MSAYYSKNIVSRVAGRPNPFKFSGVPRGYKIPGTPDPVDKAGTVVVVAPPVPSPWAPTNTFAWYDASDSTTITSSGGAVTVWADKSGNSNDLAGVDDPVTGANTQNSLNVIDIDGNDYFELNSFATPTSGDLQAFIVCEVTAVNNSADSIISMDASSNDWQLQAGRNGSIRGSVRFENQTEISTGNGDVNLTGYHIFCADLDFTDDGEYQLIMDGTLLLGTGVKAYDSQLASTVDFRIFANRGENQFPEGKIAEVILLDSTSDTNREKVEGYLAHKWGLAANLPSGHAYKTKAP